MKPILNFEGKVVRTQRSAVANKYFTQIAVPSGDEFEGPQMIEIRSSTKIGSAEDIITGQAQLGGYSKKSRKYTDRETGEEKVIYPVVMTLDLVED